MIHEAYQFLTLKLKKILRRRQSCAVGLLNTSGSKKEVKDGSNNRAKRARSLSKC